MNFVTVLGLVRGARDPGLGTRRSPTREDLGREVTHEDICQVSDQYLAAALANDRGLKNDVVTYLREPELTLGSPSLDKEAPSGSKASARTRGRRLAACYSKSLGLTMGSLAG